MTTTKNKKNTIRMYFVFEEPSFSFLSKQIDRDCDLKFWSENSEIFEVELSKLKFDLEFIATEILNNWLNEFNPVSKSIFTSYNDIQREITEINYF